MSTDDESESPSLSEAIARRIALALDRLRVMLPGTVVAFDVTTRKADVQPAIDHGDVDESGDRVSIRLPVLRDVPVAFVGSGTVRVKFPVRVGHHVMLVFASSSIARWKLTGEVGDPPSDRRHDIDDAIAWPGIADFGSVADDETMIEFTDTEIRAGGTSPLVTRDEFLKHGHLTAGTGAPSPPVDISPTPPGSTLEFPGTDKLRG